MLKLDEMFTGRSAQVSAACAAGLLVTACSAFAQPPRPTPVPTRTPRIVLTPTPEPPPEVPGGDQVSRGHEVYSQSCARCHGENLEGKFGPRLDVATFLQASGGDLQNGSTASRLYSTISREMPYDAPGSLSAVQYYDVTAFLLSKNDLLPPETIVDPSSAPKLRFTLRRR